MFVASQTETFLGTSSDVPSISLRRAHLSQLKRAGESLEVLAGEFISKGEPEDAQIYQLSLQFFLQADLPK